MNRETAKVLLSPTVAGAVNANWETPPAVFRQLQYDFGPFDVDLTANEKNHLLPKWIGPGSPFATDALTSDWTHVGSNGYSNPPYGRFVPPLLKQAKAMAMKGFQTTLLLPMRVTAGFKKYLLNRGAWNLKFCDSRICFFEDGHPRWNQEDLKLKGIHRPDPAPFDSIVVIYRPGMRFRTLVDIWTVPPHTGKSSYDTQTMPVLSTD